MSNIETVLTFVTALQSGDIELAANSMADNFTMSGFAPKPLDKNEFLLMQSKLLAAMPDFSYNLSEPREAGDGSVEALLQIMGTQLNSLDLSAFGIQSIQATGLAIALPQVQVTYHVQDDKLTAMQFESVPGGGLAGLLQQVGGELPIAPRGVTWAD